MIKMLEKLRVALKMYPPKKLEKFWYRLFPGTDYTRWNSIAWFFSALVISGLIFTILGLKHLVVIPTAILVLTMVPIVIVGFIVGAIHNIRLRKIRKWMGISRNELNELLYAIEEENN